MKIYNSLKEWAYDNGLKERYDMFTEECEQIARECKEEGYPSHGSNYELRVDQLKKDYPDLFQKPVFLEWEAAMEYISQEWEAVME